MSGRIRDEDVAHVRANSAIDEVVGEYVQLKNAGGGQKKVSALFMTRSLRPFMSLQEKATSTVLVAMWVAMSLHLL